MGPPPNTSFEPEQVSSARAAFSSIYGEGGYTRTTSTFSSFTTSPTSSPTPTHTNPAATNIPDSFQNSKDFWEKLASGAKIGIIVAIVVGVLVIVLLSVWFCCGCCGLRRRNAKRNEVLHPRPDTDTVPLQNRQQPPVTTMNPMNRMASTVTRMASTRTRNSGIAPPLYAEVAPPQHTTIAGGITHVREEEEGIISDGKTPLSEIPFEDVVLDHSPSEGSARNFGDRHLRLGGDTTGHTNS